MKQPWYSHPAGRFAGIGDVVSIGCPVRTVVVAGANDAPVVLDVVVAVGLAADNDGEVMLLVKTVGATAVLLVLLDDGFASMIEVLEPGNIVDEEPESLMIGADVEGVTVVLVDELVDD